MQDKDDSFFRKLVRDNVSGQLKVAPEHCSNNALMMMGKPSVEVFEKFKKKYFELCRDAGLEQYLVPYLMSSHPGSRMKDAIALAQCLKRDGYAPEQVQDFYPTPGTASTVMYYTGINPLNGKSVYTPTEYKDKQMQRALLQFNRPQNYHLVREALISAGREDLIGNGPECLVRPDVGGYHRTGKSSFPSQSKGYQRSGAHKGAAPIQGKGSQKGRSGKGSSQKSNKGNGSSQAYGKAKERKNKR